MRRPAPTRRRGMALVAAAAAVTLLLAGCVSWFQAPAAATSTSTPTGEKVAPDLEPFYSQKLVWTRCSVTMQCATGSAPLNWADPAQGSIKLALIRHQATGTRLGSLLVNPGGPGASGYNFVHDSLDFAVDKTVQASYDIVGFDPRGVGRSSAVSCGGAKEITALLYGIVPGTVGSDAWIAGTQKATSTFSAACAADTGALLQYVDTPSAARDLDLLRAILGDTKLNYLGYSYGTLLGATYAGLFPEKTGRLVLDGALDPASSFFDVIDTQAKGFESAYRAYLKSCIGTTGCPFTGTVDQAMTQTGKILDRLAASPLTGKDGRQLGAPIMLSAIISPLYSPDSWHYLNSLFTEVLRGSTTIAFLLADGYNQRRADGTYLSNETEAINAVDCLDYPVTTSIPEMRAYAARLAADAPVFGPRLSYGEIMCAGWPYPATRTPAPIAATGSGDILVVGTTNDPATPYVWAKNLAGELQHGHLITHTGEGHTAYNKGNGCVDGAVDQYLVKGKVPARDPMC